MIKMNRLINVSAVIALTFVIATPAAAKLNKMHKAVNSYAEKTAGYAAQDGNKRMSKSDRAKSLVVLHQEDFTPSNEALAANAFANNESVPENFSKSYKDLYAAYEHLDSYYFPLQPYYKYPILYALGEQQLIYPWARFLKEAKKILAFPVGTNLGDITIGLVGYDDGVTELVSADGQKLAMHADELFELGNVERDRRRRIAENTRRLRKAARAHDRLECRKYLEFHHDHPPCMNLKNR